MSQIINICHYLVTIYFKKGMIKMIKELSKENYLHIKHFMDGQFINLEIRSVAIGPNPGCIFVDDLDNPKTALVWSKGIEGFYFIGDEENPAFNDHINQFIDDVITPRASHLNYNRFEFSGTSPEWDETIEKIFAHRGLERSKQYVYKNKNLKDSIKDKLELEQGYQINEIRPEVLTSELDNLDFLKSNILAWWDSVNDFFDHGIGYFIVNNNSIVASCMTSFMDQNSMESHIETLKEHRRKGLARKGVNQFLKYCLEHDYEPYWDCMETNAGSRAVATSLGYQKDFEYRLYNFKL